MTEVEKDLAILPDHRMTMNHRYDCGHEMANVVSRRIRKKPHWIMKIELFMSKILTIVSLLESAFLSTLSVIFFFFCYFHSERHLLIPVFFIDTDVYKGIRLE